MTWKDILQRVYRRISRDRITILSAGVAFFALLAIFPAMAALVSIYGFFADPASISHEMSSLGNVLPPSALALVRGQMQRISTEHASTLSAALVVGVLASLWSANSGTKTLLDALNAAFGRREDRGFFQLMKVSLLLTVSTMLFWLVSLGVIAASPYVSGFIGVAGAAWAVRIGCWTLLFGIITIGISLLYRYGPVDAPPFHWIGWGSGTAATLWLVVSLGFTWYAANFAHYSSTYGSLGAIVVLMLWLWLSILVTLIGALIENEVQRRSTGPVASSSH